ncbi:MAG: tRNA glutamyl-Q(34) synthetase GluQRS [Phycisphaerales bacterium]
MPDGRSHGGRTAQTTRLAPSPTGALHLGNVRTFLVNWAMARRAGWRVVLRIEDLDGPRVKAGAAERTVETLRWLGMDWDEGPLVQSADLEPYREAMRVLARAGRVYPSEVTRGEIEASASAPQEGVGESVFPAALRPEVIPREFNERMRHEGTKARRHEGSEKRDEEGGTNWRMVVEAGAVEFVDGFRGPQALEPAKSVGDFVVWTKRGVPAYQLAVVVDDHRQGVTKVVRGDDLLDSAARQLLVYRALGYGPEPSYTHLPLVRGADGRRLAKRHGDTRVEHYRALGVRPERVVGLAAWWSGVGGPNARPTEVSAAEFAAGFGLDTMGRSDVVYRPEDDAWLRAR